MPNRIMIFTYTFVAAIGIAMLTHPGPEMAVPLFLVAAVTGIAGWTLAVASDRGQWRRSWAIMPLLFLSAMALGYGRYAKKTHIAPFNPSAEANHILSFIEAFPDTTRNDRTRVIGTIVEEPLYRPVEGRPGTVKLVIKPLKVQPDTNSDKTYRISDGNIAVILGPSSNKFREDEKDWENLFKELALPDGYGYTVELDLQLQPFRSADNPGGFDAEEFNADEHVFGSGGIYFWDKNSPPPIRIIERTAGNPIVEFALELKKRMLGVYKQTMPFPESAFLAGSTLRLQHGFDGVRCMFEDAPPHADTYEDEAASREPDTRKLLLDEFRWTGTSHVIAVSGLHVTIVTGALWAFFVMLRIPRKIFAPLVISGLSVFCLMNGASPATTRAVIMNSFTIITYVYFGSSLRSSLLLSIGVAAFAILMNNPGLLVHAAFMYSFGAVMAIALFAAPCEEVLKKIPGLTSLPAYVQQMIFIQSALQVGMLLPLSAYYACQLTLSGIVANFFAIPMMAVFIPLGLVAGLIGMIPVVGIWIALALNAANCVVIWLMLWIIHICTIILPFPMVQTFTPLMLASYYGLMALVIWYKPLVRQSKIFYYDLLMRIGGARRRRMAVAFFGGIFCYITLFTIGLFWPRTPSGDLHVNILSVRYGNAIHIETPGGANILVDAGPNDFRRGLNTGERTIAQYLLKDRIGRLDAVIMTNTSPEDMGGIAVILRIFPTGRFYAPVEVWNWDPENIKTFRADLAKNLSNDAAQNPLNPDFEDAVFLFHDLAETLHAPWNLRRALETLMISPTSLVTGLGRNMAKFKVQSGMVLWQEDAPGGPFKIVALHPNPELPLKSNNNSIVLRITYGKTSYLLPSDITEEGIRELMRIDPELLKSDVLLLPAHGSSKSDIELFYKTVLPSDGQKRYAILSYGNSRDLKSPRGGGFGKTTRLTFRDSYLSHRQHFMKDIEAAADTTLQKLEDRGIIVARTDELGAILTRSNGSSLAVSAMAGILGDPEENLAEENQRAMGL